MSKTRILTLTVMIVLISVACLTTTIPSAPTAASTPPPTERGSAPERLEEEAGAVFDLSSHPTPGPLCAIVTADQSLHMRAEPNEKAEVLAYLQNGEQVTVKELGAWWKIEAHGLIGYAKGKYLQEAECQ
jgi:uncharacterized protein YgiM (DUF1202 family)